MTAGASERVQLTPSQQKLLADIAVWFQKPADPWVDSTSDLADVVFVEDFTNRLLLHHALNADPLKKKAFEFALAGSCRAAGRPAEITASAVHPGADVLLGGVPYSCKTEAESTMSRSRIKISKLMEARWIRECATPEQFASAVRERVGHHLTQYTRILTLRAFKVAGPAVRYELWEIPVDVLRRVSELRARDFSPRTANGSSSAKVKIDGTAAFTLRLDGSVEKVTVSSINVELCKKHAQWIIPTIAEGGDD